MGLVPRLVAPGIFGAELDDTGQALVLPPPEEALVAKAAPKRRRDFALGRSCARAALAGLDHGDAVIGMGEGGAPLWPAGILGSITHTKGYAAALVAEARNYSGVGVDAERLGGVTEDLWPRLFDDTERDHLMGRGDRAVIATMMFCAKEASYKAWAMKGALAFRQIHIAPQADGFIATHAGQSLQGRYAVDGNLMLTAAWF
jgi:4'-phosphopantetheinyl transferase EntD